MLKKIIFYYHFLGWKFFFLKMKYNILPIFNLKNTRLRTLYWQNACEKFLKKYISKKEDIKEEEIEKKYIWVLWLQGKENMPELVKKCYKSIKQYSEDYDVVLLDKLSIKRYIHLPDRIENLYQNGNISFALYSDIVRVTLLARYGGIWMDATVYLTGKIPNYVKNSDVFFFQASKLEYNKTKISSWFISTKKINSYILCKIRDFIYNYYEYESYPINPFMFHLMVSCLYKNDKLFRKKWDEIPYVCNMNPHLMYYYFDNKYSINRWRHLLNTSTIHKLSWKIDKKQYKKDSILMYLLSGENIKENE